MFQKKLSHGEKLLVWFLKTNLKNLILIDSNETQLNANSLLRINIIGKGFLESIILKTN